MKIMGCRFADLFATRNVVHVDYPNPINVKGLNVEKELKPFALGTYSTCVLNGQLKIRQLLDMLAAQAHSQDAVAFNADKERLIGTELYAMGELAKYMETDIDDFTNKEVDIGEDA